MEKHWMLVFVSVCFMGLLWQFHHISNVVRYNRPAAYSANMTFLAETVTTILEERKRKITDPSLEVADDAYNFLYGQEFEKAVDRAENATKKIILFWHPDGDLSMTFSTDLPKSCGGCLVREDKTLMSDIRTKAVIILFDYTVPRQRPAVKRNLDQYWIWRCAEAPPYMRRGGWLGMADEMKFNMTLTYRYDSDFLLKYGDAIQETGTKLENPLQNKKHLILIAVSNCGMTPGATVRMQYLKELKRRGLRINTLGRCFWDNSIARMDHKKMLEYTSQHKFYFAFENSYHCKDYVTEKFFRALQAGVVPVVWGPTRDVYERYIPSSGFIFLEDFPSMQSFIDYLNYLDGNDTAYLEYFSWRTERHHHPHHKQETSVCHICRFLQGINVDDAYKVKYRDLDKTQPFITDQPRRKIAPSIKKWWEEEDNPDCYANDLQLDENGRIVVK